jgi:acyl carrier protein
MQQESASNTLASLKAIVIDVTKMKIAPADIREDANLFDDCGLDSTSVVDLVLAIEEKFGITIQEEDLEAELFQNISNLACFVNAQLVVVLADR